MSRRYGGSPAETVISIIVDIVILILWIALYLFDANTANTASSTVSWIHDTANLLSGWSRNMFTIQSDNWRTVVGYGLPAAVYLLIGHAVADRVNRT
ncbi:hypothetical protein OHT68_04940 [Streptomyces canus]|uniref:hypothetical protein n=1 Tax=Streptomyces canus TaxID=58343 RepID=UPI002E27BA60|nr:hypothetical protein [Streptomyces canus]